MYHTAPFQLPKQNFQYKDFEPYLDAQTMEIHYSKHHNTYVNNLNQALQHTHTTTLQEIIQNISKYNQTIRNNAGGHFNHTFFWEILSSQKQEPMQKIRTLLEDTFGSIENFKQAFTQAALKIFGSGWVWLGISRKEKKPIICSTRNQDNPLMDIVDVPCTKLLIGLDVWEHAYYLKYQNQRAAYIEAFWNIIHWEAVEKKYIEK